jgi:transcription elongation factor GreA
MPQEKKVYISKDKLEQFRKELQELKTVKRREVIDRIEKAKEMGDLSENAEYAIAKDEQAFIEGRILELEDLFNTAIIIDEMKKTDAVSVGSKIKVKIDGEEKEFEIVGITEADPVHGKISNESPLGRAMLGRRKGDEVEVLTPRGKMIYTIIDVF